MSGVDIGLLRETNATPSLTEKLRTLQNLLLATGEDDKML